MAGIRELSLKRPLPDQTVIMGEVPGRSGLLAVQTRERGGGVSQTIDVKVRERWLYGALAALLVVVWFRDISEPAAVQSRRGAIRRDPAGNVERR